MAGWTDGFDATGSGSATKAGVSGKRLSITGVYGWFSTTGPATGTLRLKDGSTTIWEASVSGGLHMHWAAGAMTTTAGNGATLELTGGQVRLLGVTEA